MTTPGTLEKTIESRSHTLSDGKKETEYKCLCCGCWEFDVTKNGHCMVCWNHYDEPYVLASESTYVKL